MNDQTIRTKPPYPSDILSKFFEVRKSEAAKELVEAKTHKLPSGFICGTDTRAYATPDNKSLSELVLDASEGFIPLWAEDVILRWRFQEQSLIAFENPDSVKLTVRSLLSDALIAWGDASPVKFSEKADAWDFEIVIRETDRCSISGCVLASAFFPDPGRHELRIYPKMFEQSREEQVETMIHEIGHIFGLRHFFAKVSESEWPSEIFGEHNPFSIMNYGDKSVLTDADRADLMNLYSSVRSGELRKINGTPIRLLEPFHVFGESLTSNC